MRYLAPRIIFDMKPIALTLFLAFTPIFLDAQTESDTTVYSVADAMPYPLLNSCDPDNHPGWTADSVRRCAESQFFTLLARNIRYPEEARINNVQGTVVVSCIIEPSTGKMSQLSLLKDIGSGCGAEAIRVLQALDGYGLRWQPGILSGKPVRVRHAMPIRFKLQEALPYYVSEEGDTIYTSLDKGADFKGGVDSLLSFIVNQLDYPSEWEESCKTGVIEMATVLRPNGTLKVTNQLDFSNLGMDFQFEALRLARKSSGMWIPAEFAGKPVASTLPLRVVFKSDAPECTLVNDKFDRSMLLADEGATLLEEGKTEEAIAKWNEALQNTPDNCELLYYRGTAYTNLNKFEEACTDFNRVRELLGFTWFEDIRRLVCGH